MKSFFYPEAAADLLGLYKFIAESSGPARALSYIGRIEKYCTGFELASERGARRDDIRPGLRVVGFERRVSIAFHIAPGQVTQVTIDRIFYGGRDLMAALSATPPSSPHRPWRRRGR